MKKLVRLLVSVLLIILVFSASTMVLQMVRREFERKEDPPQETAEPSRSGFKVYPMPPGEETAEYGEIIRLLPK